MPLSAKTLEHLALVWECFETEPKINYEKFRALANLASAHSARELLRVAKKKLREEYGGAIANNNASSAITSPASAKKTKTPTSAAGGGTGRGRKRAAPATLSDDDDDEDDEFGLLKTPVRKKAKAAPKSKGKEKAHEALRATALTSTSPTAATSPAKKSAPASSSTTKTPVQVKPEPREDSVVLDDAGEEEAPRSLAGGRDSPVGAEGESGAASPIQYTFDLGYEEEHHGTHDPVAPGSGSLGI